MCVCARARVCVCVCVCVCRRLTSNLARRNLVVVFTVYIERDIHSSVVFLYSFKMILLSLSRKFRFASVLLC